MAEASESEAKARSSEPRPEPRYVLCVLAGEIRAAVTAMIPYYGLEDMLDRLNQGGSFAIIDRDAPNSGPWFDPASGAVVISFTYSPIFSISPVAGSRHRNRGLGLRQTRVTPPITLPELELMIEDAQLAYAAEQQTGAGE